ncbi:hypothetical protein [Nocardia cyriacigeorgica]|uniref:hypothetical protein n=1 Tax=Nocardia cyriacigeorgica TaxID=135487 RepID=UPI0024560C06|nr:hypothetical protein [Nocardia cyriacigeorgica]
MLGRRGSEYQPNQDVSEWVRFNLIAYHQQAQTVHARWERSGRVWTALTDFAEGQRMDQRLVTALHGDRADAGHPARPVPEMKRR